MPSSHASHNQHRPLPVEVQQEIRNWWPATARPDSECADIINAVALRKLFWRGCDPVPLLHFLSLYSRSPEEIQAARKVLAPRRKLYKKLAKQLRALAPDVKQTVETLFPMPETEDPDTDLVDGMINLADYLENFHIPMLNATLFSRGASLQKVLVCAVKFVQASTAEPQYEELADLLSVFRPDEPDEVLTGDALRKTVAHWNPNEDAPTDLITRPEKLAGVGAEKDKGPTIRDLEEDGDDTEDDNEDDNEDDEQNQGQKPDRKTRKEWTLQRYDFAYLTDDEILNVVKTGKKKWARYWQKPKTNLALQADTRPSKKLS